jgi:murein DD-endopeptidase MepM/ murein hydrolase activator NlpD
MRGAQIATVGCSGWCTGPHVHFVVIVNGVAVNPLRFL